MIMPRRYRMDAQDGVSNHPPFANRVLLMGHIEGGADPAGAAIGNMPVLLRFAVAVVPGQAERGNLAIRQHILRDFHRTQFRSNRVDWFVGKGQQ